VRVVRLSVNVNKIATLRNSRGGATPSVAQAVEVCVAAGAPAITVHPRAAPRHNRLADSHHTAALLRGTPVEYNIEGDPRPELIELVHAVRPTQCTLVPVLPGELTSQAGWPVATPSAELRAVVRRMRDAGIRVSLFIDPDTDAVHWAAGLGADRVELYTEPFARAFERGQAAAEASFELYAGAAVAAAAGGLGVNAGLDLDLDNLPMFRRLPHLDEVSIGHALISHALVVGLGASVRAYLDVLA
jgi:pyridoxine 5-phosphate synthase